jgi:hypothetical protein
MTKKLLIAMLFVTLQITSAIAQTSADQLKDEFIKTYNPDGYNGYHNALDLRDQGLSLVSSLKNGLNQNIRLTESFDPLTILNDFNRQIQNIEALEANFNKETNTYDFNAGQSIGNNFSSGNFDQGMNEVFGYLGGLEGRNQARRQAEAKKASLRRERDDKMGKAYTKAQDYNNQTILEYVKAAAFAESVAEENHFYSYVTNLECFSESMESKFSTTNSYWLTNKCTEPIKNEFSGIENKFVTKDVQYLNIAKRKYKRFQETGYEAYRDGAIAFTAAVADEKPTAKVFTLLGDYYTGKSNVLALTNYLAAQSYNKDFIQGESLKNLNLVKTETTKDIKDAIETNNKAFLNTFLSSNLDKTIIINGKSILNYAIELDQPDAVQIILNKYIDGKPQSVIQDRLQKTIMMAAIYDSPKLIQRFDELGSSIDFEMKGYRPIEVAEKSISIQVFDYYIENLEDGSELLTQYKSSPINILLIGKNDPISAGKKIDTEITDNNQLQDFVNILVSKSVKNTNCYYILGNSLSARKLINNKPYLKNTIQERLVYEITHSEVKSSKAADIISSGILEYEKVPTLGDLLSKSEYLQVESTLSKEKELDFILDFYKESLIQMKNMGVSQYYTQKTKDETIAGIENEVTRLSNIKANISNITEKQRKEISTIFLSTLGGSEGYFDLKRKYYDFYLSTLKKEQNYTMTEKFNISIGYLEEVLSKLNQESQKSGYDATIWTINNLKKNLEKVNELSKAEIQSFNKTFSTFYLLPSGKDLDAESLRFLLLENYIEGEDSYLRNDYSIALIAFKKEDAKLFKAIDKHYDMNSAFNSDGSSLLINMLNEGSLIRESYIDWKYDRKIKVEKSYLSKDFNFNKKIGESYPIEILLQNAPINTVGQTEDFFAIDLKDIKDIYNVDFNRYYPLLEGTILHWYVARLVNESILAYNSGLGEFIKTLNIDKSIVNAENLTAYELYVVNKKTINKKVVKNDGSTVSSDTFFKSILK